MDRSRLLRPVARWPALSDVRPEGPTGLRGAADGHFGDDRLLFRRSRLGDRRGRVGDRGAFMFDLSFINRYLDRQGDL